MCFNLYSLPMNPILECHLTPFIRPFLYLFYL